MEAAVRARQAGRQAVRDVAPDPLRERIYGLLDESAMVPGVLALSSARAIEGAEAAEQVEDLAAGVQLVYEGLGLTRALADGTPWERDPPHTDGNVDVLAADVMVARGFSILAHTPAADKAVETVKSFGRDQTDGRQGRATRPHALEADVFELAVLAGTTPFETEPPDALLSYAAELATSLGGDRPDLPEPVPEEIDQAMADIQTPRRLAAADDPRPSATDP